MSFPSSPSPEDCHSADDSAGSIDAQGLLAHGEEALSSSTPDSASPFFDGSFRALDPRYIPLERVGWWITIGLIGGGIIVGLFIQWFLGWAEAWLQPILWCAGLLFVLLMIIGSVYGPPLAYRFTSYAVSPLGLQIRRGILWRHLIDVPRSRIQHSDVSQGPIARQYGLATLTVYTAGTGYASVALNGIAHEEAQRIRDFLVRGEGEDAV